MKTDNNTVINNHMDEQLKQPVPTAKKPDESTGVYVQALIKIFDPESDEIFINKRA